MGKYYAKQMDPEFCNNWDVYYSEDDADYEHVWIGGNSNYKSINEDLVSGVERKLDNCQYDIEQDLDADNVTEEEQLQDIVKTIKWYFVKNDNSELTNKDLKKLFQLCDKYASAYNKDSECDIVCQVLEIIYGEPFEWDQIRGDSQGDWADMIHPSSMSKDHVDYIESIYFGTGSEWALSMGALDDPEEFDDSDYETYYTCGWSDDSIKDDLIRQSGLPITKDDIELIYFE